MAEVSLQINYTSVAYDSSADGSVIIEQADLKESLDSVSKLDAIRFMADKLYGMGAPVINCIKDSSVVIPVYIYPYPSSLLYSVMSFVGTVGPGIIEQHEVSEILDFSGDSRKTTKYPPLSFLSKTWQGQVYNDKGGVIIPPEISVSNGEIVLSGEAVGSLEIRYLTMRHTYNVKMSKIDIIGGKFTTWVYAAWDGGVEWIKVAAPPCVDVEDEEFSCGFGHGRYRSTTRIGGGGGDDPPSANPDSKYIKIDYCSQEPIE